MDEADKAILRYISDNDSEMVDELEISRELGSTNKERAFKLSGTGHLEKHIIHQSIGAFTMLPKGERALWSSYKRFMFELIDQHGWELFKWVISFIAGGSALALVKYLLDKLPY